MPPVEVPNDNAVADEPVKSPHRKRKHRQHHTESLTNDDGNQLPAPEEPLSLPPIENGSVVQQEPPLEDFHLSGDLQPLDAPSFSLNFDDMPPALDPEQGTV